MRTRALAASQPPLPPAAAFCLKAGNAGAPGRGSAEAGDGGGGCGIRAAPAASAGPHPPCRLPG